MVAVHRGYSDGALGDLRAQRCGAIQGETMNDRSARDGNACTREMPYIKRSGAESVPPSCGRCGTEWAQESYARQENGMADVYTFKPRCSCWQAMYDAVEEMRRRSIEESESGSFHGTNRTDDIDNVRENLSRIADDFTIGLTAFDRETIRRAVGSVSIEHHADGDDLNSKFEEIETMLRQHYGPTRANDVVCALSKAVRQRMVALTEHRPSEHEPRSEYEPDEDEHAIVADIERARYEVHGLCPGGAIKERSTCSVCNMSRDTFDKLVVALINDTQPEEIDTSGEIKNDADWNRAARKAVRDGRVERGEISVYDVRGVVFRTLRARANAQLQLEIGK